MSNLLSKRYKNNRAKAQIKAQAGKELSNKQKVKEHNQKAKEVVTENVVVMKETKTLMLD